MRIAMKNGEIAEMKRKKSPKKCRGYFSCDGQAMGQATLWPFAWSVNNNPPVDFGEMSWQRIVFASNPSWTRWN
jgi:hypothetical protein